MDPLLAIDVGNTSAKWGLFRQGDLVWVERVMGADVPNQAGAELERGASEVALASVSRAPAEAIQSHLGKRFGRPVRVVGREVAVPVVNRTVHPDRTGVDRLLVVLAAARVKDADRPAVVVDCGSAITVNAVSAEGALLGGAILPGLGLALDALHDHTDALPRVTPGRVPNALGTSTEHAIRAGVVLGCAGAIERLVHDLAACLTGQVELFITGSDAPLLGRHLSLPIRHVPHLTLWGIYHACRAPQPDRAESDP